MFRQILLSLVILGAAVAAYVFFVPGGSEMLARLGLPVPAENTAASAAVPGGQRGGGGGGPPGAGPGGPGGPGGGRGGFASRSPVVVTAPVVLATINDQLTAIGEGAAVRSVTVVSPAAGTLAELAVAPGDRVTEGQIIARLDSAAERITFERATLALADAEAALNRTRELAGANNATTVQVSTAQLAFDNARLALQDAELALERRTITTPIGGTVGLFQINLGNAVPAQTVVTTIEDTSEILVSFWVPERYAPEIQPGMPLTASAVALPGVSIEGVVGAVDNRIDPASRTLQVQARIPNANGRLRPGMSFSVAMSFPGEEFAAVDPLAIQWSAEGSYLWQYVEGRAERVPVQIVQRNSDGVMVKAELTAGDFVITQGVQQLTAGAEVRLLDDIYAPAPARTAAGADDPS